MWGFHIDPASGRRNRGAAGVSDHAGGAAACTPWLLRAAALHCVAMSLCRLPEFHRLVLVTEGRLGVFTSKLAASLLRYRAADIVALVDSAAAGRDVREVIPWSPSVPIFSDVDQTLDRQPDALVLGVTPVGGALPDDMRGHVECALRAGVDVVSGMHTFLDTDAELAALAQAGGARIWDLRRPPTERIIAAGRARTTRCRRVLTVGTDGNVGKMVTALELTAAASRRGLDARFLATGQTGIAIAGSGVAVDACVADFAAGAVESLVLDAAACDVCFVEGQGGLGHPGFSPVTLALVHGACPDALVLVHQLGRTHYKAAPDIPLPSLATLIRVYEETATLLHSARVVGVALNTFGCATDKARAEAQRMEADLKLPVVDPVRDGCERLLEAVLSARSPT